MQEVVTPLNEFKNRIDIPAITAHFKVSLTYLRRCQIIFGSYNGIQIWKKISIGSAVLGNMRSTIISLHYLFKYPVIQESPVLFYCTFFPPFSFFISLLLRESRQAL